MTREGARVDRIACPWLIRKFVDPKAEFLYVPRDRVLEVAQREGATAFDAPGAELNHYTEGDIEYVTFDAILRRFAIKDPAVHELAKIVRVADGGSGEQPEAAGLLAAATGFHRIARDDLDNQRLQFPLYDALYAFCRWRLEEGAAGARGGPAARPRRSAT